MKLHAIYHFSEEDKHFDGDYHYVDLFIDGKKVLSLGSNYDEKSEYQIEGFKQALKFLKMKFKFTQENIADSDL